MRFVHSPEPTVGIDRIDDRLRVFGQIISFVRPSRVRDGADRLSDNGTKTSPLPMTRVSYNEIPFAHAVDASEAGWYCANDR